MCHLGWSPSPEDSCPASSQRMMDALRAGVGVQRPWGQVQVQALTHHRAYSLLGCLGGQAGDRKVLLRLEPPDSPHPNPSSG